ASYVHGEEHSSSKRSFSWGSLPAAAFAVATSACASFEFFHWSSVGYASLPAVVPQTARRAGAFPCCCAVTWIWRAMRASGGTAVPTAIFFSIAVLLCPRKMTPDPIYLILPNR